MVARLRLSPRLSVDRARSAALRQRSGRVDVIDAPAEVLRHRGHDHEVEVAVITWSLVELPENVDKSELDDAVEPFELLRMVPDPSKELLRVVNILRLGSDVDVS